MAKCATEGRTLPSGCRIYGTNGALCYGRMSGQQDCFAADFRSCSVPLTEKLKSAGGHGEEALPCAQQTKGYREKGHRQKRKRHWLTLHRRPCAISDPAVWIPGVTRHRCGQREVWWMQRLGQVRCRLNWTESRSTHTDQHASMFIPMV